MDSKEPEVLNQEPTEGQQVLNQEPTEVLNQEPTEGQQVLNQEPIARQQVLNQEPTARPASKITSTIKKTKPKKDPGRVAAGKRLAEFNKRAKTAVQNASQNASQNKTASSSSSSYVSSSSITQVISVVSILVSIAGLYYKRKEINEKIVSMMPVKPKEEKETKSLAMSENSATHSESKLKPMD